MNVNTETGIPFGIVSGNDLDADIIAMIQDEDSLDWEECKSEQGRALALEQGWIDDPDEMEWSDLPDTQQDGEPRDYWMDWDEWLEEYDPGWQDDIEPPDEERHERILDGVHCQTTWVGGAIHVWVFQSPYVSTYRPCSPCMPGAHDIHHDDDTFMLDGTPQRDGLGYTVPPDWFNPYGYRQG